MAQTKKKRRRKHRGTQGGKIDARPRSKPRNRAEAKQQAKARRSGGGKRKATQRNAPGTVPPSWGSAVKKSIFAGIVFFALLAFAFGRPVGASAALAGFMLAFYIPMAYFVDKFFYDRKQRKDAQERLARSQQKGS